MGDCEICDGDDSISYRCNECDGLYCSDHRLPEAHDCTSLKQRSDTPWFKDELSTRASRDTTGSDSDTRSGPEPMSTDDIRSNRTGASSSAANDTDEESAERSCRECGQQTQKACEKCGTTYCEQHKSPAIHNCSFLRPKDYGYNGTPPKPSMPSHESGRSITNRLLTIVYVPLGVLIMLLSGLRRHWKAVLLLGVVITPIALASGGNLDSGIDGAEDIAADAGSALDQDLNQTRVETLVHERINEIRRERGLHRVQHDPTLRMIASDYSKKMATEGFYSHTSPSGQTFEDRYEAAGYSCRVPVGNNRYVTGSENILYTYAFLDVRTEDGVERYTTERELANGIVQAWMNSKGHRQNILKKYWRNEGVGVHIIENPDGPGLKVYATQNFC